MVENLRIFSILLILMSFEYADGENLWCYQCNTDLRDGHKVTCNDPYNPGPSADLVFCPQDQSYHCLKSIILYKNVLVTVRGCVPTREIDGYCRHDENFPQSSIECFFCKDYACNGQEPFNPYTTWKLQIFTIALIFVTMCF